MTYALLNDYDNGAKFANGMIPSTNSNCRCCSENKESLTPENETPNGDLQTKSDKISSQNSDLAADLKTKLNKLACDDSLLPHQERKVFSTYSEDEDEITFEFEGSSILVLTSNNKWEGNDMTFVEDSIFPEGIETFNNVLPMEGVNSSNLRSSGCEKCSSNDTNMTDPDIPFIKPEDRSDESPSFEKVDFTKSPYKMSTFQKRVWQMLGITLVVILIKVGVSAWQLAQQLESGDFSVLLKSFQLYKFIRHMLKYSLIILNLFIN